MRPRFDSDELVAHALGVRALARSLVADTNAADDVVQDACLAALARPPGEGTPRRAWFIGVVRNLARRRYRDASRRDRRERVAARSETVSPATQAAEGIETHRRLVAAVAGLDDPYRTAVALRYFDGVSVREIALRHGVPAATVSTWIRRGLEMLRARLASERDDWRAALLPLLALPSRPLVPAVPLAGVLAMKKALVAVAVLLMIAGLGSGVWRMARPSAAPSAGETATSTPPTHPLRAKADVASAEPLPPPVDLAAVDRDLDLHGVVVDAAGAPVAGATVQTTTVPWPRTMVPVTNYGHVKPLASAVSATDGTFALRLRRGECVNLRASKPGVGECELPGCQAGERVRAELRRPVVLVVSTVDARGGPVADSAIDVHPWTGRNAWASRSGTTDARGTCRIDVPPGGSVNLTVVHATAGATPWTRIDVPDAGELPVRIVMEDGRTLRGRVTDAATGAAIDGARISSSWRMQRAATSGADGGYALPGCARGGAGMLHCMADGFASATATVRGDDRIDFALARGDRVAGRIVGHDGLTVGGASIAVIGRDSGNGGEATRYCTSADDGTFSVAGLGHDQPHMLVVDATGHGRYLLDFDPPEERGGTRDLGDVVLPASRSIGGRVVGPDGAPVPHVRVDLDGANDDVGRLRPGRDAVASMYGRLEERRTDDLGRFRYPDLSPGSYTVTVGPEGGRNVRREVELTADADADDLEIQVAGGDPFTVIVVDAEGAPAPMVLVQLSTADEWSFSRTTDAAGRAVFTPGAEVRSVWTMNWPGGRLFLPAAPVRVAAGTSEVRLVLEDAELVTGTLVGPDGQPVGQGVMDVTCDGRPIATWTSSSPQAWTGWDGRFELRVPKGRSVDISLTGYARAAPTTMAGRSDVLQGTFRGIAAGTRDVVLHATAAPRSGSLTVVVRGPDGDPEPGALVTVFSPGGTVGPAVAASRNGRAYLADLPAVPLSVTARLADDHPHRGDWLDAIEAKVNPSGQEIEIAFRAARAFQGVVLGPDGAPVEGATVSLYRDGKLFSERKSGKGGGFVLPAPTTDAGVLYLFVWHRPDADRTWEFRQDAFRVPTAPQTIRFAARDR